MVLKVINRLRMYSILAIAIVFFDVVLSLETEEISEQREKRQSFAPMISSEVKEQFRNYAKSYLNYMVTQQSKRNKTPRKQGSSTSRAQICAEVCQHRCLPSCEWSCCIKENIEEYRHAHLLKPLVSRPGLQRKSSFTGKDNKSTGGKFRESIEEPIKDGHECNPSCKRYCVPSCRFACCQPVQIKGVLLL